MKLFNQEVVNKLLKAEKMGAVFYFSLEHKCYDDIGYGFGGDYSVAEWVTVCKDNLKSVEYENNSINLIEVILCTANEKISQQKINEIEDLLGVILKETLKATQEDLNSLVVWS